MKNIKRVACLAMAGICMAAFVLGGCGKQEKESTSTEKRIQVLRLESHPGLDMHHFLLQKRKDSLKTMEQM